MSPFKAPGPVFGMPGPGHPILDVVYSAFRVLLAELETFGGFHAAVVKFAVNLARQAPRYRCDGRTCGGTSKVSIRETKY